MAQQTKETIVVGPAGGKWVVLTKDEQRFFEDLCDRYTQDYAFQNVSDLSDLERVIQFEVLGQRINTFISMDEDYWGEPINAKELNDQIKTISGELRQLKKSLGIDRSSRRQDSSESLSDYIERLKQRAKAFGVMRETQLTVALTLFNDLQALITLYENCTEEERREQGCTIEDILKWLKDYAFPEYQKVDKHFIENEQRYYIQEM